MLVELGNTNITYRMFIECDGVILGSNPSYEGPAIDLWKKWFDGRPVMSVGPMTPIAPILPEVNSSSQGVATFLENALEEFGPNSVVYVSSMLR